MHNSKTKSRQKLTSAKANIPFNAMAQNENMTSACESHNKTVLVLIRVCNLRK